MALANLHHIILPKSQLAGSDPYGMALFEFDRFSFIHVDISFQCAIKNLSEIFQFFASQSFLGRGWKNSADKKAELCPARADEASKEI
jgi:hypothetical protein